MDWSSFHQILCPNVYVQSLINFAVQFFWETELLERIKYYFWRKPKFWHIWMAKWSHRSLFISLNLLFLDYLNLCTWNLSQSVTWVINTHTHTLTDCFRRELQGLDRPVVDAVNAGSNGLDEGRDGGLLVVLGLHKSRPQLSLPNI